MSLSVVSTVRQYSAALSSKARTFLAQVLAYKMPPLAGEKPRYNATFQQHYDAFGVKLVITGTNLETGKSGYFSHETTPDFPVADAVRMSMGIPIIFKPYVIRREQHRGTFPEWVNGVWVDGGYLNNIPITAFDREPGPNPKTLGLRLGFENVSQINTLLDFFLQYPLHYGFMGVGEAQVLDYKDQSQNQSDYIILDTTNLSLLDFNPPADVRDPAIRRAKDDTLNYFNLG